MKTIDVNRTPLNFGFSTLYIWIHFFECLLHVGYKIDVQKWQTRKDEKKLVIFEQKRIIQATFKKDLHLNIDKPKQGFCNNNDGNTA